jgi:hypothetical protein
MKLRKAIKKIVALGTGMTMVGATLLGAMAADLKDYPSPLVKDGVFDGSIVVGDSAASSDVVGAIDIATSLQYSSTTTTTVSTKGTTQVTLSGDSKKISESTNVLELNETLTNVKTGVTGTDLKALAGGEITNEHGTFSYSQDISLGNGIYTVFAIDPDDDTNTPAEYLKVDSTLDPEVYTYKLAFSPAIKTDHSTAAADNLEDIEDKKITILGKEYTIISTTHPKAGSISLTLMGGAVQDTMQEYETKTYTINGVDYEVEVVAIGGTTTTAILKINGEVTNRLAEGETYKLKDGTEVGVKTLLENEGTEAGGYDIVELYLGANKIKITDTDTNSSNWGGTLQIGSDTINNIEAEILKGSDAGISHGDDVTISSIKLRYNATEDLYVPKDGGMAEVAKTKEDEEVFIEGGFDIEFKGLEVGSTEEIKLKPSGNNNYILTFKNKNGYEYNVPAVAYDTSTLKFGKYSGGNMRDLVVNESEAIDKNDYFSVNKNKYSHVLQFKSINQNDKIVKLKDIGSGDTIEVTYTGAVTAGTGTLNLDGNQYKVNTSSATSIYVDLNGDATIATTGDTVTGGELFTELGLNITIRPSGGTEDRIVLTTEKKEGGDTSDNNPEISTIYFYATSGNKIDMNSTSTQVIGDYGAGSLNQVGDTAIYQGYDMYGTFFEQDTKSTSTTTDQDDLTITYPDDQVTSAVFVTSGVTTATTTGTGGEVTTTTINPISVGAAKLASEVADITAINAIVVGGPCANAAAATLMGNPEDCLEGFTEGKAIIKLYENGDNVAILVAGMTALDTRRASRVLANYKDYALSGKEVEVSGTSLTDITVSAPATE